MKLQALTMMAAMCEKTAGDVVNADNFASPCHCMLVTLQDKGMM